MSSKIKVTFLGTSAQIPTAKRNHTAILLNYEGENILVDCGEGTQRQFRIAKLNPCKVNRILITHKHGDHVFGLPGLISTFEQSGYNKTLYIYGPRGIKKFLEDFLALKYVKRKFEIKIEEVSGKFLDAKDFYFEAKGLSHGIPTYAYSFVRKGQIKIDRNKLKKSGLPNGPLLAQLKHGKDISYNGKKFMAKDLTYSDGDLKISIVLDTEYKKDIISFVKGADLLIAESSFSFDEKDKAHEHLHLTAKEAGEIAKQAKVRKLVLTHISQRYDKNPKKLLDEARKIFKNSFLANDLDVMEV